MHVAVFVVALALVGSADDLAGTHKVDGWKGFAGLTLGEKPSGDFPSAWTQTETERSGIFYKHRGKHPPFMGSPLKDLLVVTSKRYGVVVAFGMTLRTSKEFEDARVAMEKAWGPAFEIKRDEFEWEGYRVDIDLEMTGMGCFIWARDKRWDDTRDEFKR